MTNIQTQVKPFTLEDKLGKQDFHYDTKQLFESTTKAVTDSNQKLLEETKINKNVIENLDKTNKNIRSFESRNKYEVIH